MKFGYEGAKDEELIRNYKINDDKIIITFLDGSNHEVPLTEEVENDLLNRMLMQAQERNDSMEMSIAIQERRGAFLWAMYLGMVDLVYIESAINANTDRGKVFAAIFSGIVGLTVAMNGLVCKTRNDEIKELKKYAIYLYMKDRLEEVEDKSVFLGVNGKEGKLNINTLDDYSLRDIKRISKNLERVNDGSHYAESINSTRTFQDDSSCIHTFTKRPGN